MRGEEEWNYIQGMTNPYKDPNVRIIGDYDGEIYEHYWKWEANTIDHVSG